MSKIEVLCNCGWYIKSNDKELVLTKCKEHDLECPLLFKSDDVLREIIDP